VYSISAVSLELSWEGESCLFALGIAPARTDCPLHPGLCRGGWAAAPPSRSHLLCSCSHKTNVGYEPGAHHQNTTRVPPTQGRLKNRLLYPWGWRGGPLLHPYMYRPARSVLLGTLWVFRFRSAPCLYLLHSSDTTAEIHVPPDSQGFVHTMAHRVQHWSMQTGPLDRLH